MKRSLIFAGALALGATIAGTGFAEPTAEDKAAAEALFQEALKLTKLNNYPDACPKLEASNKLDPAVGTLFNLGDCYEHTGRTASAWSTFGEARRFAEQRKDRREKDAAEREKSLEPKLAKLVVKADDKPEGLTIRRDKKPIDTATLGSAVPVDPGKHTIEVEAPGREPWSTTVDVPDKPGEITVSIPALAALRATPSASASASGAPLEGPPEGGLGTRKIVGIAVAGVGVASLVAGGVFGGLTLAKVGDSKQGGHCIDGSPVRCDSTGLAIRKDAETLANVSNITLGVGAAALIAGAVVFLTAPSGAPAPPAKAGRSLRVAPSVGVFNGLVVTGTY
jgi:serine/threonine-protein kinase